MPSSFSEHPVVGWLVALTDPYRIATTDVWRIDRDGAPWVMASNGKVLAMTPDTFGLEIFTAPSEYDRILRTLPTCAPQSINLADLRALLPTPIVADALPECETCGNTGRVECDDCDGDCYVDCVCAHCEDIHERDCRACNGQGYTACACGRAAKPLTPDYIVARVGDGYFNVLILRDILAQLGEHGTWAQDAPDRPTLLRSGAWEIMVMPLNPERGARWQETAVAVPLTAVEHAS